MMENNKFALKGIVDVENQQNVDNIIKSLKIEDLVKLWKILSGDNRAQFCKRYNINPGNFSKLLLGEKMYKAGIDAIKTYILGDNKNTNEETEDEILLNIVKKVKEGK